MEVRFKLIAAKVIQQVAGIGSVAVGLWFVASIIRPVIDKYKFTYKDAVMIAVSFVVWAILVFSYFYASKAATNAKKTLAEETRLAEGEGT